MKKIALISDIHGNAIALEAVLASIAREKVDNIICLGDVVTISPQPKEVLTKLQFINCFCIIGNHDAALLDLENAAHYHIASPLISSLKWCTDQLSPAGRQFLSGFQQTIEVSLSPKVKMLCYHGSPLSNTDLLLATSPPHELDVYLSDRQVSIMAGGHSHIQMLRQHNGVLFINPGSVGHAFRNTPTAGLSPALLPHAEYAIVQENNGVLSVDLRRVPFDIAAFVAIIQASDIPIKDWLLTQYQSFLKI